MCCRCDKTVIPTLKFVEIKQINPNINLRSNEGGKKKNRSAAHICIFCVLFFTFLCEILDSSASSCVSSLNDTILKVWRGNRSLIELFKTHQHLKPVMRGSICTQHCFKGLQAKSFGKHFVSVCVQSVGNDHSSHLL